MNQKKKISRKVISYVLALVMVFSTMTGIVPGMSLTAYAASATYIDGSGESQTVDATELAADTTSWTDGLWYIAPAGGLTISGRITVNGTVNLILRDGATLTANAGITTTGATLNIYAQSAGTGALTAKGSTGCAGIGGRVGGYGSNGGAGGTVSIFGGTVTATGGTAANCDGAGAGIGGGGAGLGMGDTGGAGGTVSIFGGTVTATGGTANSGGGAGAGIGGGGKDMRGSDGASGTLTLGKGVKLYNGTNNTGDVLDGNDSTQRPYSGNRPQKMFAEVSESKAAQEVNPPAEATDLTYKKDQAQALLTKGAEVTTGNQATGSVKYRVGTDGTWSTEIPTGTNAGTYSVYYKVLEDETYAEYAPADPISVTIAKADPVALLENAYSAKYGQYAKDVTLPEGWKWADPEKKFESTGEVVLTANFAESDNYIAKTKSISVLVVKAAAKISYAFSEVAKEYGSTSFTNEIENTGDVTPTYISSVTSVATVDGTGLVTIKGIGETTITANVAEDNDHYTYETRTASYKLIVNPVSTVISTAPKAADITYGQKLSESTLSGGVANVDGSEETVAGKFEWKEPDLVPNASDSGEYEVEFTPTDTTNYAKSTCKVKVKVNKAAAPATKESLSPEQNPAAKNADDLVYTGEPIELVTAPANPLEGYKVQYSKDNGTTWTDTIPTETNVDTYTVKVKYVSDNYETIDLDDIKVTITSADKTALTDAIVAAKAYYDTIKGNTDYSEAADKLDKAIKAAEEVAKADKLTKAEVSTATEALNTAKATAEAEVKDIDDTKAAQAVIDKINELKPVENIKPEDRTKIEAAREAYKKLSDDQKTKLTGLDSTAVSTLEAAEQALDTAEKAAFDAEKEAQKKAADALAADGDSDASKKLIEDAKKAIDALAYDETKSLDENKKAVEAILTKLKEDLTTQRAADKKEADDTAAAKKVTDAINALPASDKIATTDKAAIEAARKAYDALTADQKKKVSADVLKKLTDAETALKAAEKDAADKTAADKVIEAINKLPSSDKVATTDKAAIEAARKAYDALSADQKKKVSADTLKKLTDAETALTAAEKKAAEEEAAKKKEEADTKAANAVVETINKLPVSNKVATTDKAAIEAARKAYDALSADQKKKVSADTLKKLTDAETALKAAEKKAAEDKAAAEKKAAEEKAARELAAAKEEAQAAMNEQVTVTQKGKKFTVKWKKSSAADGYYVYAQYCGKKITKPAKTIAKNTTTKTTITKINGKKINQKKQFCVYVVPYKIIDGKKVALGKSTVAHLVGAKSTKYSNVKKLTLTKKKYTVKVGKTAKIKAKVTLVNKNKKHIPKGHGAKFRYKSSDTSIATVDKNGKIKGIKKGKCTIYVYSINGLMKKAKVTIK